jgi:transcriptional regulator with XRE-family HTH domain
MLDVARVFGHNVRQHRRDLGMKQVQLAQAVGLSGTMISEIERGHFPSMDVALKLAAYFQVPLSRLIGDLEMSEVEEESEPSPTDAIQIRVIQLFRDLAFMPNETRNLMSAWIQDLGAKLHTPLPAPPPPPVPHDTMPSRNESVPPVSPTRGEGTEPEDPPVRPHIVGENGDGG